MFWGHSVDSRLRGNDWHLDRIVIPANDILQETEIVFECSVLDICFFIRCSMFDLPAMPLGGLGRMSSCLGPMTMIIQPSFVMHGRRVFDVHLSKQPLTA